MRLSRRSLARLGVSAGVGLALARTLPAPVSAAGPPAKTMTPDQALQALLDGNKRFQSGTPSYPNQSLSRRAAIAAGQQPFASVLSCIDSRVPPELVFDQGLGDLFVARVGAAMVDDALIGSIEFTVDHYNVPLVVVMGHQNCGAVSATIDTLNSGGEAPGHIGSLVDGLEPGVIIAAQQSGDLLDNAIRANIHLSTGQLRDAHPILDEAIASGALKIVGMYYSVDTGAVEVIDPA